MKSVEYFILGFSFNSLGIVKGLFERNKSFLICSLGEVEITDYSSLDEILGNKWEYGFQFIDYYNDNILNINQYLMISNEFTIQKVNKLFAIVFKDSTKTIYAKNIIYSPGGYPQPIINNLTLNSIQSDSSVDSFYFKNEKVVVIGNGYNLFKQLLAANRNNNKITILNPESDFTLAERDLESFDIQLQKVNHLYKGVKILSITDNEDEVQIDFVSNGTFIRENFKGYYNGLDFTYTNIVNYLENNSLQKEIMLSGIANGIEYYEYSKLFDKGYELGITIE